VTNQRRKELEACLHYLRAELACNAVETSMVEEHKENITKLTQKLRYNLK